MGQKPAGGIPFLSASESGSPLPLQWQRLSHSFCWVQPLSSRISSYCKSAWKHYDYHRRDIAADDVDYLNVEDPDVFSHRAWELEYQRKREIRRDQPARTREKTSYDIELKPSLNR